MQFRDWLMMQALLAPSTNSNQLVATGLDWRGYDVNRMGAVQEVDRINHLLSPPRITARVIPVEPNWYAMKRNVQSFLFVIFRFMSSQNLRCDGVRHRLWQFLRSTLPWKYEKLQSYIIRVDHPLPNKKKYLDIFFKNKNIRKIVTFIYKTSKCLLAIQKKTKYNLGSWHIWS